MKKTDRVLTLSVCYYRGGPAAVKNCLRVEKVIKHVCLSGACLVEHIAVQVYAPLAYIV